MCDSLALEDEYNFIYYCFLYKKYQWHVGNPILNINEMNQVDMITMCAIYLYQ